MKFSQIWCMIVVLLFVFAGTVSFLSAQTEEPSAVNTPSRAEVQLDSVEVQSSSDEPEQKQPTLASSRGMAATNVEAERLFNELRRELLDDRAKKIDDRAEMINWWLVVIAIILTFFGIAIPIIAYNRLNKLEESEKEARRYVEDIKTIRDEIEIDRMISEAISLQQQNRTGEAIEKWRSIANITEGTDEHTIKAWFNIGYLLSPNNVEGEDFAGAIAAYSKAIELNPNLAAAYNNRGVAKRNLGQYEAAIADYDEALRLDSTYVAAYNNRGIAKMNLDQYEAAIADFDAALRLDSTCAEAYNSRGVAKMNLGQHEAAITDFDAVLRLNPNYAEAYCNRGIAKGHLDQYEAAIADYNVAIYLNPDHTEAYYNRGIAQVELHHIDVARQDFETALNLAQAAGNADLAAQATQALRNLDRGDAP